MNYYCGTDIIEISRIKDAILNTPNFKEKIFTSNEILYSEKSNNITRFEHFAGRFAAKEAVYKSISNIFPKIALSKIEIINDKNNCERPIVIINDKEVNSLISRGKLKIDVSISHIKEYAIANAIAVFE